MRTSLPPLLPLLFSPVLLSLLLLLADAWGAAAASIALMGSQGNGDPSVAALLSAAGHAVTPVGCSGDAAALAAGGFAAALVSSTCQSADLQGLAAAGVPLATWEQAVLRAPGDARHWGVCADSNNVGLGALTATALRSPHHALAAHLADPSSTTQPFAAGPGLATDPPAAQAAWCVPGAATAAAPPLEVLLAVSTAGPPAPDPNDPTDAALFGAVLAVAEPGRGAMLGGVPVPARRALLPMTDAGALRATPQLEEIVRQAAGWLAQGRNFRPSLASASAVVDSAVDANSLTQTSPPYSVTSLLTLAGFVDPDTAAHTTLPGLAIVGIGGTTSHRWEVRSDPTSGWVALFSLVQDTDAVRLAADSQLRLVIVDPTDLGTASLTVRAWDRTDTLPADRAALSRGTTQTGQGDLSPYGNTTCVLSVEVVDLGATTGTTGTTTGTTATTGSTGTAAPVAPGSAPQNEDEEGEGEGDDFSWWIFILIGLGACLLCAIVLVVIVALRKPRKGGSSSITDMNAPQGGGASMVEPDHDDSFVGGSGFFAQRGTVNASQQDGDDDGGGGEDGANHYGPVGAAVASGGGGGGGGGGNEPAASGGFVPVSSLKQPSATPQTAGGPGDVGAAEVDDDGDEITYGLVTTVVRDGGGAAESSGSSEELDYGAVPVVPRPDDGWDDTDSDSGTEEIMYADVGAMRELEE